MRQLKGLGTALITPFDANGKVDYEALARLLDTQLTGFVDYIVVLGTTGEAATMTEDEKAQVRQFIRDYIRNHPISSLVGWKTASAWQFERQEQRGASLQPETGGVLPLVLGVGGNNTAAVCESLRTIDFSGFSAILSVCPYYNKPNQEGLYQHFCKIAEASPLPIILYNVPGRTGVNLLPETVMRIYNAHPDKIIGIKEASGNLDQIKHLIDLKLSTFNCQLSIISGDDGIACEVMEAGGAGLISVASNAFPEDFWHIVHDKDAALQAKYAEMVRLLFAEGNPVGIKAVLAQKGIIQNYLRLPLVPASKELQNKITQELAYIKKKQ